MNPELNQLKSIKRPTQQRSVLTLQRILASSGELLAKQGFEKFNTNSIASHSGLSVGTIYQYFKSKEDIIQALIDRHVQERSIKILRVVNETSKKNTPRQVMTKIFYRVAEWHQLDEEYKTLYSAINDQLPLIYGQAKLNQLDEKLIPILLDVIQGFGFHFGTRNPDAAMRVLIKALRGTLPLLETQKLGSKELEESIDEICSLIIRFFEN